MKQKKELKINGDYATATVTITLEARGDALMRYEQKRKMNLLVEKVMPVLADHLGGYLQDIKVK